MNIKRICVYCGSSKGASPEYLDAAARLGKLLADRNIELIYGGASIGIMGRLADTVLKHGGRVTGIIPEHLSNKVAHSGLTEIRVVNSMHTRKAMMIETSDAMIALPGGLGTFEEILEAATWRQLELHVKPCGLLNVKGYYNGLLEFLDNAVREHFVKPEHRAIFQVSDTPETLLEMLENFKMGNVEKWLD
ncbi:MAG: LOG family protein [Victivallaceae bacterium]